MTEIIQIAGIERLLSSPQWQTLCEDWHTLTKLRLDWLPADGRCQSTPNWVPHSPICAWLWHFPKARRYYTRVWNDLSDREQEQPLEVVCDAGLMHLTIPVWHAGARLGNLFIGGYRIGDFDLEARNRFRHFIFRLGIEEDKEKITALIADTCVFKTNYHRALRNRLIDAASGLARQLQTRPHDSLSRPLPAAVARVCKWIRRNYDQPLTLPAAAVIAQMNESYFCRLFRISTGLRFIDYVNEVRLTESKRRLLDTKQAITTIAFASGFGSLSQFNRAFLRSNGCNPRTWRTRHTKASLAARRT